MKMKKIFLFFVLAGAMPLSMMAQDDDLYFTPSKSKAEKKSSYQDKPAYYVGSTRDVDEYNRHGKFRSRFQKVGVDSLGNDIIEFQAGTGIYPDTSYVDTMWVAPKQYKNEDEDYTYSRRMSRWDDYYGWYDPWFYGHWGWRPWGYHGWYGPWYSGYYGWYDPWYDPWYYGYYGWGYGWGYPYYHGYYGWYDPWYYGYNGWGGRYYGSNIGYAYTDGVTGTRNHGYASYGRNNSGSFNGRSRSYSAGTFGGSRAGTFGSRSTASRSNNGSIRVNTRSGGSGYSSTPSGNFGGSRSSSSSYGGSYSAPARSSSSSGSYSGGGGGSFGGSRSSGGGGGGGRSGGGGFGGRR